MSEMKASSSVLQRLGPSLVGRTVLGRFEVVRALARGGMGMVYLARSRGAGGFLRPAVVKAMGALETAENIEMFLREAQVLSAMRHPNIVQAIDFQQEGGEYLLAMEYVEGYTLARWARFVQGERGDFPVGFAVQVVLELLEALAYAHELRAADGSPAGVIHRDVTPTNVLVTLDGHVKLVDFGIARVEHEHTTQGPEGPKIKGKFAFLSPELLDGQSPSASSDVYAAALVLHELLVGRQEMAGEDMAGTLLNVVHHVPSRADEERSDVPAALAEVLARALLKRPEQRYPTARALAEALRAARPDDPQRTREALVAQVRADFHHPGMVEAARGADLETLNRAWQSPAPLVDEPELEFGSEGAAKPAGGEEAQRNVSLEEVRRSLPPTLRPGPPKQRNTFLLVASVVAVLAALGTLGVAVVVLQRTQQSGAQSFVVVEGAQPPPATPPPSPAPPPPPPALPAAPLAVEAGLPEDASAPEDGGRVSALGARSARGQEDPAAVLTRQFARHRDGLERCARRFPTQAATSNLEALHFDVDTRGQVVRASLVPPTAAEGPLGECVLRVARGARFDTRGQALGFRLPVSVHVGDNQ